MLFSNWPKTHPWVSETKTHGENMSCQLLGNARRCIHIGYRSNAWASCGAGSEHGGLTGELGHRGHECHFSAPAGFQPWLQPCRSMANVTHRNLASTCTSAQHRGHGTAVLLWMSGWSYLEKLKILWSQIQGFFKLTVTDLQPPEMFTGMTASRAESCLNQWLSWFGVVFFKSQNEFPVGNLIPYQEEQPHDLGAPGDVKHTYINKWHRPGTSLQQWGHLAGKQQLHASYVLGTVPGTSWLPNPVWALFDAVQIGSWQEQCLIPTRRHHSQPDPHAWNILLHYLID